MPTILENARIDQLPLNAALKAGYWGVLRNMDNGVTERFDIGEVLTSTTSGNFEYDGGAYDELEAVTWKGQWYQAIQDVPAGIVPGTNALYWNLITKSNSGLTFWKAGVFPQDEVFVLYDVNENPSDPLVKFFWLRNGTRPFVSSDFLDELANGDWEEVFVSAIGGIDLGNLFPVTYFVSPLGDDATAEPGNLSRPYTLDGVLPLVVAGDNIQFLPGTYTPTGNIAKDGVFYSTFGGTATINFTTPNETLFDYSGSNSMLPVFITGEFYYKLNAVNSKIFKFNDAIANYRSHVVTWQLMDCIQGSCGFVLPRYSDSSRIDGQINMKAGYTGYAMSTPESAAFAEAHGGTIYLNINNETAQPAFGLCSFRGYIINLNYYASSTGGLSANFGVIDRCIATLNIDQPTGTLSRMPSGGTINASLVGGQYDFRNSGKIQLDGQFKTCELLFLTTNGVYVSGRFDTVFIQGQGAPIDINGTSNNMTLYGRDFTLNGTHIDADFLIDRVIRLNLYGILLLKAGEIVSFDGNALFNLFGTLIGDNASGVIRFLTQPGNKCFISGIVQNKSVGAPAIVFVNNVDTPVLILKQATIVVEATATESISASGAASVGTIKLLGKSYSNKSIGGPGVANLTYPIEPVTDYVVDTDVEILDINL